MNWLCLTSPRLSEIIIYMFRIRLFDKQANVANYLLVLFSLLAFASLTVATNSAAHSEVSSPPNNAGLAAKQNGSQVAYEIKHEQAEIIVGSTDENKRAVNLLVSYPVGAQTADQKFPLIVFSHGHALDNLSYQNLTNYWVARGYFVVAPLHLDSGGDLKAVSVISKKYGNDWIAASRLLDLKASIDQIDIITAELTDFVGQVSTDKIIAAGHSYGALSAQQLSGAKLEDHGDSLYPIPESLTDSRVVSVVAISPPGLMKDHLTEATWSEYSTPQLVVTGPNDFFPFIWPNYEDHFISYQTAQPGHNYLLVLDEMDHYLGNLIGRLERDGPPQDIALKNLSDVSLKFIEHYLNIESTDKDLGSKRPLSKTVTALKRDGVLRFEHR